MNSKQLYRIFGLIAFLVTLIVFSMTVQPSVPFWDCGEFTAASTWQQVPHPPGAPLFLIIGRIFQIIIPFGDLGWRVNMVSVVATALTSWLLYIIIVKTIINFRKNPVEDLADSIKVYGSALVGALAYSFSDTVWFNGVESEVYAMSTLFTAIVVYLMMRWNEEADNPGHERFLLLIAYVVGLSTGVHLLAILTVFSIVLLVYFRKYEVNNKSFTIMSLVALLAFWLIYKFIITWIPTMLSGDFPLKNEAREHIIEDSVVMTLFALGIIGGVIYAFYYGMVRNKPILKLVSLSFLLILFGFLTYTQVLLRSNANPPMNENEPKNFKKMISYLGREQYGDQGNWPRRNDWNDENKIRIYNSKDENGEYIYGPWYPPETKRVQRKDGSTVPVPVWSGENLSGDLAYLWKYQIMHMYFRYFFWNYVGRSSDIQDAQATFIDSKNHEVINYRTGYADQFPVRFFALPLLFGLFGLFYHFKRDPKMALVFLVMFLLMGVLAAIAQNQQDPQPRERDYFYTGSFLVWCLWIGMGVYGLIETALNRKKANEKDEKEKKAVKANPVLGYTALVLISLIAVPVNMAVGGWNIHTRADNYLPFDYSYNILQSLEKDAILFTNGDNDTFPLWFMQDVEGVRRDVRVVNLSLGQTLWYIHQLKNREPWGAKKIPLSFSNESLQADELSTEALSYQVGEAKEIVIPVKKEILARYTNDTTIINSGQFRFTFTGTPIGEEKGKTIYVFYVNHQLIADILKNTKFERPVYYAATVGPDVFVGLENYLRYEGLALRVCPVRKTLTKTRDLEPEIMDKTLLNIDNSDNFHREPHYGFKLRNLDNKKYVYYDEVHRRLMMSYRRTYMLYSNYLLSTLKNKAKAAAVLDTLNKYVSTERFPLLLEEEAQMSFLYAEADDKEKAKYWAEKTLASALELINNPYLRRAYRTPNLLDEMTGRTRGAYSAAAQSYILLKKYDEAENLLLDFFNLTLAYYQRPDYAEYSQYFEQNLQNIFSNILGIFDQKARDLLEEGKKDEAEKYLDEKIKKYNASENPMLKQISIYLNQLKNSFKEPEIQTREITENTEATPLQPEEEIPLQPEERKDFKK